MRGITRFVAFAILGVALWPTVGLADDRPPRAPQWPLDYKLASFEAEDVTFVEAISKLSLLQIEGLHLGLEEVLRESPSGPLPRDPRFSIRVHNNTVRQVLDRLCDYDGRYIWAEDGSTINVYPKETVSNPSYLLNRRLEVITVTAIPNPQQALTFLDKQLPPPREQLAYAGVGGDSNYEALWTQTFRELTVRQFINRLSEHMGPHTSWIFYGSKRERLFTFLKGGFH
jgi:hypothetical protein